MHKILIVCKILSANHPFFAPIPPTHYNIYNTTSQLPLPETSTSQPRNLNFCCPKPQLLSSCSVRRPIRFRPPSDQIPSATRSDSVRHPIGFRPPSATLLMLLHQSATTYTPLSQSPHKTPPLHPHPYFRRLTLEIRPFSLI